MQKTTFPERPVSTPISGKTGAPDSNRSLLKRGNRDELTDHLPGRTIDWQAKASQSLMILEKRFAHFEPVGTGTARRGFRPALSRGCMQCDVAHTAGKLRSSDAMSIAPDRRTDCERDWRPFGPSVSEADDRRYPDAKWRHQMTGFLTWSTNPATRNALGIPGKDANRT